MEIRYNSHALLIYNGILLSSPNLKIYKSVIAMRRKKSYTLIEKCTQRRHAL